jgi:hypothetical protein
MRLKDGRMGNSFSAVLSGYFFAGGRQAAQPLA